MIDNSSSMADKHALLASSIPRLISRLAAPRCLDASGAPTAKNFPCDAGSKPEFAPVTDLHVGVITSSLGAHGGELCSESDTTFNPEQNDHGRLLGSVRQGLPSQDGLGFLAWAPGTIEAPSELIASTVQHINAVGEVGCAYEAQLESWYRFLVDPQPPDSVKREGSFSVVPSCQTEGADCGTNGVCVSGFCADKTVLSQRKAFLRGDSAVAIVMLTDENDCSIADEGQGWLIGNVGRLPRSTSACATNPDDPCCSSCAAGPPSGCAPHASDPECQKNDGVYADQEDHLSLRCWEQKRRYGFDFLHPVSRYVSGLKSSSIVNRGGDSVPNPLYSGNGVSRDLNSVVLAGVVGVPWQLIATQGSSAAPDTLEFLPAREIEWSKITRSGEQPPSDPHMIESTEPRAGLPTWTTPNVDPIHGHDWDIGAVSGGSGAGVLQYACIFPRVQPRDCSLASGQCDCHPGLTSNSPVCWNGAEYTSQESSSKAYPSLRQLEVLRETDGVVASICAKTVSGDPNSSAYGYNAAADAVVARLSGMLGR